MSTAPAPIPASPPEGRFTVLLGDSRDASEPWHRTAVGLLESQGVETVVPDTGRDALDRLERAAMGDAPRIHVAVLEQAMNDMTGLQVLRRLRERIAKARQAAAEALGQADGVPPAILLAHTTERGVSSGLMSDALTIRVFSVLPRPVDTDQLLDTLARALQRRYAGKWPGQG